MKDKFYIFGLMRSGTNAFSKYSLNLGIRCLNDPFLNGNCDYNDKVLDEPPVCWKHSIPTLISTEYPIVICFKDKDSQYKSLQKAWDKYGTEHHFSTGYQKAYGITKSYEDFLKLYSKYREASEELVVNNENVFIVEHDLFCQSPENYFNKIFDLNLEKIPRLGRVEPGLNQTNQQYEGYYK